MRLWTYAELSTKVEQDLAIQEELFVPASELVGYFNEAVEDAEKEVLGLYEDYFLSKTAMTITTGVEEYSLPSDIFAEKIRRVIFNNGSEFYSVGRLRDWKKFEIYADVGIYGLADQYRYFLYNPSAGQSKMVLVPKSRDTGAYLTLWYIRTANEFTGAGTDILDIPESANFIMQYVKVRVIEKDIGNPNITKAMQDLDRERDLLKVTLSTMVPDANNEIEPDLSYYEEMN